MPYKDPEKTKEYQRRYRKLNPDKRNRNEYARAYRTKNADRINIQRRILYIERRDVVLAGNKRWRDSNPDKVLESRRRDWVG